MGTCALFADYENVYKSLRGRNVNITHKQLAEVLKQEATRFGEIVVARAYAPWDIFPEAMSILDRHDIKPEYVEGGRKDNADVAMSLAIQDYLRVPGRDADTFILVTGDGDFVHVVRLLQQEKKRVVVWGVDGSISNRLVTRVADVANIQDFLNAHGLTTPPAADLGAMRGEVDTDPRLISDPAVRSLILRSDGVMLDRGWVQVPFLTLMQEMSISTLFGEDSEQRRALIVRCLEAGILETKKQPNPKRPGTDTTFVLLKKDHPVVAGTLQITSDIVEQMRLLLGRGGGSRVPLAALDRALAEVEGLPPGSVGAVERRKWIDLCVTEGILRLEQVGSGEAEPSWLYLVESHPIVQQVVPGEDLSPLLRWLVLSLDHYLTRTGYAWMSMGLLRQQLAGFGQQSMERAIRVANETGIIVVRQQPNQFGSRPTTGTYLQQAAPYVEQVLGRRDALLESLYRLFQGRDVIPRHELLADLAAKHADDGPGSLEEWLSALTSHQLLEETQTSEGDPAMLLHKQHPVVVKRLQGVADSGVMD